ncbi:imidazolonepropionase [Rhizoclosmatium globosum]|uniref:Probable imidazolonepropionase n=1 Tax=Rhizoclosmatium globosum TaxID=329046 RepID=A0A1Y2CMD2_9FUNG|nr:imidazolonepropionase [Rhizoclosmatium globosum]|eukprot:ORY48198.1 imidazolonepropionase [Rhizoclosmatium globosum]
MAPTTTHRLRLRNAAQVVCISSTGQEFKRGKDMNDLAIKANASIVVAHDGKIAAVGTEEELLKLDWYKTATFEKDVNAEGKSILPGFCDGHSHPVWAGDRVHEFELKLAGATYLDIHKQGGGIGYTVAQTRAASHETLEALLTTRLNRMLRQGTTLLEAKSGYGLETATELKMLQVLKKAQDSHKIDISATFLGAHSVPKGSTPEEATKDVLEKQIPAVVAAREAGDIYVDNIDIFMEKGIFDYTQSEAILTSGKTCGMCINFHGDELNYMASAELGAKIGARAISHLEEVSDDGIAAMAAQNVFGVLLPTTAYVLRITPPPARKMIDNGVLVALGSDFNPNAHCLSMPFVMNLAAVTMRMTLAEALVAATLNAAASVNKSDLHGSIEVGKWGNFVIVDDPQWTHVVYEMVDSPVGGVYVKGEKVV